MAYTMKRIIGLLVIIFSLNSCGQSNKNDFPDIIHSEKTENHFRIEGTKVFCLKRDGFILDQNLVSYKKKDSLLLTFIEGIGESFEKGLAEFIKHPGIDIKLNYQKNIQFNNYHGFYAEGTCDKLGQSALFLVFGDDSFMVIIRGVYVSSDKGGKKELQEMLKTIYYDKTFIVSSGELAKFSFDETITNFKKAQNTSFYATYTESGKMDITNKTANFMAFLTKPRMSGKEAENFLRSSFITFEGIEIIFESKNIIKTKINDYDAFIVESKITLENKKGEFYQVVLLGKTSTVIFLSSAFDKKDEWLLKFKKTVESITIK